MDRPQHHWFFQRVHATHNEEYLNFELAGGLAFLLRRFHMIQAEYATAHAGIGFPLVGVEFIDGTGAIRWQKDAIPAALYSAPRFNGVTVKTETKPADMLAFGVNLSAVFKPRSNTINLFYDVGELVRVKLTGFEYIAAFGNYCPDYLDFAIEGVYIPNMPTPEKKK